MNTANGLPFEETELIEDRLRRFYCVLRRNGDCLACTNLDHAPQFCRAPERRCCSLRRASAGHRRKLLRDNDHWRGQQ